VPRVRLKEGPEGRRRAQEDGTTGAEVRVPPGEEVLRQNRTGTPAGSTPPPPGSSRPSPSPGGPCGVSHATVAGMVHGAGTQEDPRGRRRWVGDETFVRVAGKTMYPGFGVVDWGGRTLSRVLSPRRREAEARGWFSPRGVQEDAASPNECTTETGYTTEPSGASTWTGGRESSCTGGSGSPRGRLHHQPPGGGLEPLRVLVWGAQGFKRWANAQHYHEQYIRARNHPEKTLIQLLIPDK